MIVAGDSLADVGTFGYKATVQNRANAATGYPVYPEIVAANLNAPRLCNYFASSNSGQSFTTNAACTDYAVGSAYIVNPVTRGGATTPFSLQYQLEQALAVNGSTWKSGDLIVVDAGANDAANLAEAYLNARYGNAADDVVFLGLLGHQLSGSTINDALAQPDGGSVASRMYMQQLARTYWNTVKTNTVDRSATRLVLLNVPDITLTPRFRTIIAGVATNQGATAAADFQAAVRSWITAFNTELAFVTAADSRVAVVDYAAEFNAENTTPAAFGLTNTTQAACPQNVDFPQCTDAALDAAPPAGLGAGWWKTYLYSDRFHPTPRGHELIAARVMAAIDRAGFR